MAKNKHTFQRIKLKPTLFNLPKKVQPMTGPIGLSSAIVYRAKELNDNPFVLILETPRNSVTITFWVHEDSVVIERKHNETLLEQLPIHTREEARIKWRNLVKYEGFKRKQLLN
jgi:hypothetical protein